ncbi:DsbA family oxidoreductase [soil metagenome]
MKPQIEIEVVSDVVCPWCYIGKRRLEKAVEELKNQYDVKVSFSPFELNPDMPAEGVNQKQYLIKKFGNEQRYQQLIGNVTNVAKEEGLVFNYDLQTISPNTHEAHRMIWFAAEEGKQPAVKEALMKAYFEEGVDLSKRENLIATGVSAGLDKDKLIAFINSDRGLLEVATAEGMNKQRGISGVPFYIINNKYGISGAQASETFVKALTEIGQESSLQGEMCDVENQDC